MNSEIILIGNTLVYAFTLLFSIRKKKSILGIYILVLYTFISFFGYMFYIQPGYWNTVHGSEMSIFPFIYLYLCLMFLIVPILNWKGNSYEIKRYSWKYKNLNIYLTVAIILYLFLIILNLSDMLRNMTGDLAANRENVYGDTGVNIRSHFLIYNPIYINLDCFIKATSFYTTIISAYLLLFYKRYKKKTLLLLVLSLFYPLETGIILVSRGPVFCLFLCCVFIYLIFYNNINKKVKKKVLFGTLSLIPLGFAYFTAISEARFDNDIAKLFFYKYMGESMTNFNGLMFDNLKGTTDGTVYFTFFIRPFYYIKYLNGYEKWEYIEKLTGVSGQYFYTIVGGLLFEFGKILTLIICIGCYYLQKQRYRIKQYVTIPQLLILVFFAKQLIFGLWTFNLQGPECGYEILGLLMFCYAFKNNRFFV